MTCNHVLDLIDAGPFADCPRAHLDAAWEHARHCATCGPALQAATTLSTDLAALSPPASPPHLTAVILARLAWIEPDREEPDIVPNPSAKTRLRMRDWPAWATALGGVSAGLAVVSSMSSGGAASIDPWLPRISGITVGLSAAPATTVGTLVLAAGLVLYVVGLFAPLRSRSRP